MTWRSLILFLNRTCPVGCATCNAGCLPHHQSQELSPTWLMHFFKQINNLSFSGYVIWTGGEPFLSFPTLSQGIQMATASGFHSEILTSGVWFKEESILLKELKSKGSFRLRVSVDAEHQKTVSWKHVMRLVKHAQNLGIQVDFTFRSVPSSSETVNDFKKRLQKDLPVLYDKNRAHSRWIHSIETIPQGRGGKPRPERQDESWKKSCPPQLKDLVVGEDGYIYPCCGIVGISVRKRLRWGNPLTSDWEKIAELRSKKEPWKTISQSGPGAIFQNTLTVGKMGPFRGPCHMCLQVLIGN